MVRFLFSSILFLLFCSTSFGQFSFQANALDGLTVAFDPEINGWVGADIGSSIHLFDDVYIYFYGDTLVGNMVNTDGIVTRQITGITHGSVAYVNLALSLEPTYVMNTWSIPGQVDVQGIVTPQNPTVPGEYYWMIGGVMGPKTGYLYILCVVMDPQGQQIIGADIVSVSNPVDLPDQWDYTTSRISSSSSQIQWTTTITLSPLDGYIYIYGVDTLQEGGPMILSRIDENDLFFSNWAAMEFWSYGGEWLGNMSNIAPIFPSLIAMTSVQFHPYMDCFFMLLLDPGNTFVTISLADSVVGPWNAIGIYDLPPPYNNQANFYSYGSMAHLEYCGEANEIVFSYTTNLNFANIGPDFSWYTEWSVYPELYHPLFVSVIITPDAEVN